MRSAQSSCKQRLQAMHSLESYCRNRRQSGKWWPTSHAKWSTPSKITRSMMLNFLLLLRVFVIGVTTSRSHITLWKYSLIIATCVRLWVRISWRGGKCDRLSTCLHLIFGWFIAKGPSILRTVLHVDRTTREMPSWKTWWPTILQPFRGCYSLLPLR